MIGFGSFSHGSSSSSSSNLSPLAQPFIVDRSVPKPNLNPLVPFAEDPYSYSYQPTFDNWLHLHPPIYVPDSFSCPNSYSESDSIHAPIVSNDGYYGSQPISSFGTHIKPKTTSSVGSFPYDQQQSESIRSTLVEAKPYYRQYPSAAIHDDTSPVVLNDSACDMLSASNFAPLDGTYQTRYTGSFPAGYTDQWSGFCDGLPGEEQGRRKGLDGNSFSSRNHGAGSLTDENFLKHGTPAAEGLTAKFVDIAAKKSSSESRGTGWIDDRCSSLSKVTARVSPNFSKPGDTSPASMLQEPQFLKEPFPASVMETWSSLFSNTASYERCFTQLDSCTPDPAVSCASVTNSTPTLVFGARASGTNGLALLTGPSRNLNFSQQPGDAFDNDESAGSITSNIKESFIQTGSKGEEAYGHTRVGRNDNIAVDYFPSKKDALSKQKPPVVDSIDLLKGKSELQAYHFKLSEACNMVSGGTGATDSTKWSSEISDQFNPAVDSPCWKGVLSSHQSPFGVAEVMSPDLSVKEFEGCNSANLEGHHILTVNADEVVALSSQKEEGGLIPDKKAHGEDFLSALSEGLLSVGNFPSSMEDGLKDSVNAARDHSKVNLGNEILCSDGIQELTQPRKEHGLSICSNRITVIKPSHMEQISHQNNITLAELSTSEARFVNSGMDIKDPAQDGSSCVHFSAVEHSSSLPFPAASVSVGLAKQFGGASDTETEYPVAKIDIRLLVNAIRSLSELLLSCCFNDVEALKEHDHEVLQHVINNLDACLSKKVGLMRPMSQLQFPESSTCCLRKLTDPQKVSGTCRSQVNSVEAVNLLNQHDLEGEMHPTVSGKQGNKLQDFASMKDETGIKIDNDMTQAIKKIMEEKLSSKETHPQTILFKQLWLEAEAALCSIKYKARYDRWKIEMEKWQRAQEKGKPIDIAGHLNPEVSHTLSIDDMSIQEMEESAVPDISAHETQTGIAGQAEDVEASVTSQVEDIEASVASKAEDIEASVMARFHILNHRVNNCSSMNKEHLLNSTVIGAHAGKEGTMSSPCESGIQNIRESQPIKVVDVGFLDRRKPLPIVRDRSEDGCLEVTIRPYMQHGGTNCREEKMELDSDVPEQQATMKEFGVCISDELVNTHIPNPDGNQCAAGRFDSPAPDWEHILRGFKM
ncbi:hypothetical protein NE237_011685 [Protea cynaroides]|uniref:Uncharacterized protein n=1 Tax=Protea cynaroides TaxID=273540 RepID=A0A9Q0JXA2_9MAGN|nr:hypothetical protein NE237_011685 [Protea cynaroides]